MPTAPQDRAPVAPETSELTAPAEPAASLEALYRSYAPWLRARLIRRLGRRRPEHIEDLLQETWLRAARASGAAPIRHPRSFLLRIAERLSIDAHRRDLRAPFIDVAPPPQAPDPSATPPDQLVLLRQVVQAMPPRDREVFLLSRYGLTYPEIAARLNVPMKTVEGRMSRALAFCLKHMRR